ncbi:MAG: NYN domain-containing protein [Pyrinomonadaceae bacterium]
MQFDSSTTPSWKFGHRGRVAVFIDGNNLFHAARFHSIDIDYNKLLRILLGDGRLLRAFFYTGVDAGAERQQGFLLWMRRNGFRVVQKELKTFYDGTRKANLDVEIAVDMLSLAGRYDTAVLVSGDEDFVYAINAVAYKGCRVEVAGFRSNTAPRLIDVADFFIDLGEIAEVIRKDASVTGDYDVPSFLPDDLHVTGGFRSGRDVHRSIPPSRPQRREDEEQRRVEEER